MSSLVRDGGATLARVRAPLATAAGLLSATALVAMVDPHQPGHYPICPLKALTGLDCPFCGGLRATHDLAHARVGAAASENLLLVLAAPLLGLLWLQWWRRSARNDVPLARLAVSGRVRIGVGLVLLGFAVLRNTSWGSWLAS